MNGFTWIQNRYCLQNSTNLDNFESRSFKGMTLDGRHVYILKEQFNLLPKRIQDAFGKINQIKFHDFQSLTKEMQVIANKKESLDRQKENYTQLQKRINIDVLKNLRPYLSVNTREVFYLSSHHLKKAIGEISLKDICEHAALEGNLEILKWARKNGAPWREGTCACAAGCGHLEVLKWAKSNGAPWNVWTCASAAEGGHLDVLKWARNNGAPWDVLTCAYAAKSGHFEVLEWARNNGAPWDERACAYAALGGRLEVLKWARNNGAPWDERTCAYAAVGGHLEALKWARENGAPWNIAEIRRWAISGAIEWLNANP